MSKRKKYHLIIAILLVISFFISIVFLYNKDKILLKCEAKNIESKINSIFCDDNEYIECASMFYYSETQEVKLYFNFDGYYKDSEFQGMCKIADYVSRYIKNNPKSFLFEKKVTLGSESCDRLGDIKICNFDPSTNESFISTEQFNYGYFDGYFYDKEDFSLSKMEKFDWFEILDFSSDIKNDDYSILLNFPELKEIRCNRNFFSKYEQDTLRSNGISLSFNK